MPPPKKPKLGPTRFEAFLSAEELSHLQQSESTSRASNTIFSKLVSGTSAQRSEVMPGAAVMSPFNGHSTSAALPTVRNLSSLAEKPNSISTVAEATSRSSGLLNSDELCTHRRKSLNVNGLKLAEILEVVAKPVVRKYNGNVSRCANMSTNIKNSRLIARLTASQSPRRDSFKASRSAFRYYNAQSDQKATPVALDKTNNISDIRRITNSGLMPNIPKAPKQNSNNFSLNVIDKIIDESFQVADGPDSTTMSPTKPENPYEDSFFVKSTRNENSKFGSTPKTLKLSILKNLLTLKDCRNNSGVDPEKSLSDRESNKLSPATVSDDSIDSSKEARSFQTFSASLGLAHIQLSSGKGTCATLGKTLREKSQLAFLASTRTSNFGNRDKLLVTENGDDKDGFYSKGLDMHSDPHAFHDSDSEASCGSDICFISLPFESESYAAVPKSSIISRELHLKRTLMHQPPQSNKRFKNMNSGGDVKPVIVTGIAPKSGSSTLYLSPALPNVTSVPLRWIPTISEGNIVLTNSTPHLVSVQRPPVSDETLLQTIQTPSSKSTGAMKEPSADMPSTTVLKKTIKSGADAGTPRLCVICNDLASGLHYRVWSCEGCKAFFKRSIQGPVHYVCPSNNTCIIDKTRRRCCQACRLRKCLETGMFRSAARKESSSRLTGQNKTVTVRRKSEQTIPPSTIPSSCNAASSALNQASTSAAGKPLETLKCLQEEPMRSLSSSVNDDHNCAPIHPIVEQLQKIEPVPALVNDNTSVPYSKEHLLIPLFKLFDRELFTLIEWAKNLPGYSELPLNEQVHLMECSWMELLLVGICWKSLPSRGETLNFSPDYSMTREHCTAAGLSAITEKLRCLIQRLTDLQVKFEQIVLIKALVLFNADIDRTVSSRRHLEALEEDLHEALHYTTVIRLGQSTTQLGHLLSLLPHLRQISLETIVALRALYERLRGLEPCDLLKEMLDALDCKMEGQFVEPVIPRSFKFLDL